MAVLGVMGNAVVGPDVDLFRHREAVLVGELTPVVGDHDAEAERVRDLGRGQVHVAAAD